MATDNCQLKYILINGAVVHIYVCGLFFLLFFFISYSCLKLYCCSILNVIICELYVYAFVYSIQI